MAKYRLNFGKHHIGRVTFKAGDIIESDLDLATVFAIYDIEHKQHKFTLVADVVSPAKPSFQIRGKK
jgi:hypothetical protein